MRRLLIGLPGLVLLLGFCLFNANQPALAAPIDQDDFWSRLQRTAQLVQQAIDTPTARQSTLQQVEALWQGADSIRLADGKGTLIPLDLSWVRAVASGSDTASLRTLEARLQNILKNGPPEDAHAALDALNSVLSDSRFRYQPTATPQTPPAVSSPPDSGSSQPETALVSPALAQALLVMLTIVMGAVVLVYFVQRLRMQPVALPESEEEEPATSQEARDRAEGRQEAQDYRTAIRYLYLSSLLLLDERGVIHYDRSLTNREHLKLVAGTPQLGAALRPVVETFDRVWYGFEPVDEHLFATFRADVDTLMELAP